MHRLQATGSQQEYTSKFMQVLSQATAKIPEFVKRWLYQPNLRPETASYVGQNIPTSLQNTIEHAQRFEDGREPSRTRPSTGPPIANAPGRQEGRQQQGRGHGAGGVQHPRPVPHVAQGPAAGAPEVKCFTCGIKDHMSSDCPTKGAGAKQLGISAGWRTAENGCTADEQKAAF